MADTILDVKDMKCPLPVLRANRALRGMAAGERLRVLATDRAAVADFQRRGFHGPLNYYRAIQPFADMSGAFRGARVAQPSFFLTGAADRA